MVVLSPIVGVAFIAASVAVDHVGVDVCFSSTVTLSLNFDHGP